jgi:hypothetical protein
MEADYSGGQSSPWALAPRGRKEGMHPMNPATVPAEIWYGRFSVVCISLLLSSHKINKRQRRPLLILHVTVWSAHCPLLCTQLIRLRILRNAPNVTLLASLLC